MQELDHYIVHLHLLEPVRVVVGALGQFEFDVGYWLYVGRARCGLAARLARHRRRDDKTLRLHVDYLRAVAEWDGANVLKADSECALAAALAAREGARRWPPNFGASDCRCAGHLVHFEHRPAELPGQPW